MHDPVTHVRQAPLNAADVARWAASGGDRAVLADLESATTLALPLDASDPRLEPIARAHAQRAAAADRGEVYGLTTGVGALRHVTVDVDPMATDAGDAHARRLLRSHAAGVGPELTDELARATMLVRLHQLQRGGAGVHPRLVVALANAVHTGAVPRLHAWGAIGTGDLTALAELGLTLMGDLAWRSGSVAPTELDDTDALPMISSNAMTAGVAAVAITALTRLAHTAEYVAALSHLALRGSRQALDPQVFAMGYHRAAETTAERVSHLLGDAGAADVAARIQDPFGLRTIPQVHGVWIDQLEAAEAATTAEVNVAGENPLTTAAGALHHGQFVTQRLASTLDAARSATVAALGLSMARGSAMLDPGVSGLRAFLADGPSGSSGHMIVEYVAGDLLAQARQLGAGVTDARTSVSLGLEEHASHATQAARSTHRLVDVAAALLGCELATSVRALRLDPTRMRTCPAIELFDAAADAIPEVRDDHVLGPELAAATDLVLSFDPAQPF